MAATTASQIAPTSAEWQEAVRLLLQSSNLQVRKVVFGTAGRLMGQPRPGGQHMALALVQDMCDIGELPPARPVGGPRLVGAADLPAVHDGEHAVFKFLDVPKAVPPRPASSRKPAKPRVIAGLGSVQVRQVACPVCRKLFKQRAHMLDHARALGHAVR